MDLRLMVTSGQHHLLGDVRHIDVDVDIFSIGRSVDNSWVLPDPKLHISSKHCVIHKKNSEYHLTDISTNGVYVNGEDDPIGRGRTIILKNSDSLKIGGYQLKVSLESLVDDGYSADKDIESLLVLSQEQLEKPEFSEILQHVVEPSEQVAVSETIEDLLDGPQEGMLSDTPSVSELLHPVSPEREVFRPPTAPHITEPVPDSVSLTEKPRASFTDKQEIDSAEIPDNWLELLNKEMASDVDSLADKVELASIDTEEPLPANDTPLDETICEVVVDKSVELSALLDEQVAPALKPIEDVSDVGIDANRVVNITSLVEGQDEFRAEDPPNQADATNSVFVNSEAVAPVADSGRDVYFDELLEAAGIPVALLEGKDKSELARELGSMIKNYSQGVVETLATRSLVKSEFRLQQTMIRPVDNNPLKFSPSGVEALKIMMLADSAAYMPAPKAVDESFKDIQAHQLAMMSGIQAAFVHLLERFEPEALQQKFNRRPRHQKGILGRQKVDYWLEYFDFYEDICAMMEDQFQDLFSAEFAKAYEQQLRSLEQ
ncbi:type VI secretion system-associated FHA domain protein TagH [Neptunomonas sp.]|uniref:type VI secretion system-associated FHA domain protein TagH n=1 Tax=Neptunomonas sp. TaxID=1971898 RepID=UPI0025EA7CC0|nr:type VI secretion system-associated FHA domain protein TagH [Neptunomonas sp.]